MLFRIFGRRQNIGSRCFSSESSDLLKTDFYNLHLQLGGKMVPFAGYSLPVQYEGSGQCWFGCASTCMIYRTWSA